MLHFHSAKHAVPGAERNAYDSTKNLYLPLVKQGDFRVLHLKPGMPSDPLVGTLEHTNLNKNVEYNAISYVWGIDTNSKSINVNGCQLALGHNAHGVLRQLRQTDRTVAVWIDQVCVNQKDKLEIKVQLPIFPDIYIKAAVLRIWLPPHDTTSEMGFLILDDMISRPKNPYKDPLWLTMPVEKVRAGLQDIVNQPHFRRFWPKQEPEYASKKTIMQSGAGYVCWDINGNSIEAFRHALILAALSPQWSKRGLDDTDFTLVVKMLQTQMWRQERSNQPDRYRNLLEVLWASRSAHIKDVKERMTCLLQMVGPDPSRTISDERWVQLALQSYECFEQLVTAKTAGRRKH